MERHNTHHLNKVEDKNELSHIQARLLDIISFNNVLQGFVEAQAVTLVKMKIDIENLQGNHVTLTDLERH